jgi:2-haloacid dehalogenase
MLYLHQFTTDEDTGMAESTFSDIGACAFDAYGTLFDVHSAVNACRDDIGDNADRLSELWRQKQLQYTWLRSLMKQHVDFWQVTGDALDYAMNATGTTDMALRARLLELYLTLDAYPDVVETLESLKAAKMKTAILSNGSMTMLIAAAKSAGIFPLLDMILSVDQVDVFKPDPAVYQLAVDKLKLPASQISFQSSNGWDAHCGAAFGFQVAWINRFGQPAENLPGTPQAELENLAALPKLLGL